MIIRSAQRRMALAVCVLAGGIVMGGGSAYAQSPGGSSVKDAVPGHAAGSDEAKWKPGDPITSEIADAATLASVPAAAPEAPPAAAASH